MNGIIRTLSFRKKKKSDITDGSKPQEWLRDEAKIKEGCCSFPVKYLGCIEVYESRGMQVCEEAIKALRKSKRKSQKATLYVNGDALRVSDDVRQHLLVDQTIEKVSFCAPDRGHERGFAYICRDGATRRWMCNAFLAVKDSGERLSHAVGCAFAICLEKKQKRERDVCQLTSTDDRNLTRMGSYRPASLAERLLDPQSTVSANKPINTNDYNHAAPVICAAQSPSALSTGAIPRPRSNPFIMNRPGSLRLFPKFHNPSPFKRDMSLRLENLPSNKKLFNRTLNDGTIQEEDGPELTDQSHVEHSTPTSQHVMVRSSIRQTTFSSPVLPEPPPPPSHLPETSVIPSSSSPPLPSDLTDPFSAAPINPQTIQQHYFTNPQPVAFSSQLDVFAKLSLVPVNSAATSTIHCLSTTAALPAVPNSPFLSGPPIGAPSIPTAVTPVRSHWHIPTSPKLLSQFGQYIYEQPVSTQSVEPKLSDSNSILSVRPRPSFPTSLLSDSWTTTSPSFSSNWPDPVPSLLPPEPDRFADPFDVGWADRASTATACLSTNGALAHKPGNPFTNSYGPAYNVHPNGIQMGP